jgi:cell division protease FtsH
MLLIINDYFMAKKLDIKGVLKKNTTDNNTTQPANQKPKSRISSLNPLSNPSKWYKNPTLWLLLLLVVGIIIFKSVGNQVSSSELDYGVFISGIKEDKLEKVVVKDFSAQAKYKDSKDLVYVGIPSKPAFANSLKDAGIAIDKPGIKYEEPAAIDILPLLLNVGITIGGILLLIYFISKQGGAGGASGIFGMGESKARMVYGKKQEVTFDSVAGADESKQELQEIVDFLKNPQKYTKLGARIPKGVLLVGPPGTGKTLLARAISGEAGVPFFFTSGADFEELLVGLGASRVRDLFAKAKKAAPSIIFIDEIDAMARRRGSVIQSTASEQTLNAILVEMDGFDNNTGVIILAATNRADVLDPAILRPGRFDRRVTLELPDKEDRKQILAVHSKNKPLSKEIDFDVLARRTGGFSGADIENMLNEAAILTAKEGRSEITYKDIEESVAKITVGVAKKGMVTEKDRKVTAYHEAGHAIVGYVTGVDSDVHRITIVARGHAGGYTEYIPHEENMLIAREKILSMITSAVAGNATERLIFGDTTTGASDDFQKATTLARKMVMKYGMGDIGPMVLDMQDDDVYNRAMVREFSEQTAEIVDKNVRQILDDCYKKATEILTENKEKLEKVVKVLFDKETIEGEEFKSVMTEE